MFLSVSHARAVLSKTHVFLRITTWHKFIKKYNFFFINKKITAIVLSFSYQPNYLQLRERRSPQTGRHSESLLQLR